MGDIIEQKCPPPKFSESYYNNLINLFKEDIFEYTCCKAYRRSIIKNITFKEKLNLFEDEVFTCEIMGIPRKIGFVNHVLYKYVREDGMGLARKTHSDYYLMCEEVYLSWKRVLRFTDSYQKFLETKAKSFMLNCKWCMD